MPTDLIGKIIRFHRKKAELSQERLALFAGVGKTVVYDIEKGKLSVHFDNLLKIFNVLNIKLELESPLMDAFRRLPDENS